MIIRILLFFAIFAFNAYQGILVTQFFPGLDRMARLTVVAGDGGLVVMALSVYFRNRRFYGAISFVIFVLSSVLTLLYNLDHVGVTDHFNGLRQPLVLLSAVVIVYDILMSSYRDRFVQYFTVALIVFAISQIPSSVWQFLRFGAGDLVGGTYGTTGGSGLVTQLVFMISFYLLVQYGALEGGTGFAVGKMLLFSLLLAPCAINETKIAFIYLAAYIVMLAMSRQNFLRMVLVFGVGGALFYVLGVYYTQTVKDPTSLLNEKFIESYLFYYPKEGVDVPRFQKIALMFGLLSKDFVTFFVGLGYGLFGGTSLLGASRFARSLWYFGGSRPLLNTIWIQGGLFATYAIVWASFGYLRGRLADSFCMRRFRLFLGFVILSSWFYNDMLLDRTVAIIVAFLTVWVYLGGIDQEAEEESSSGPEASLPADGAA